MLFEICVGIVTTGLLLYLWLTWNYGYWSSHSIPHIKPSLFFGNHKEVILMTKSQGDHFNELYWKYPDQPAIGIYKLRQPQLLLRSTELVKMVTIKEFHCFHDNDSFVDTKNDPIAGNNPFFSRGDKWKVSRSIHTPGLTANKLKAMLPLMIEICKDMLEFVSKNLDKPLEAKYFCGQYTTDSVASCVYGLSSSSFKDPNATFRQMSLKVFESGFGFTFLMTSIAPWLAPILNLRILTPEVTKFFKNMIKDTMLYRKTNNIKRNDFLQHLMQENEKYDKPIYTDEQILAYTMTFFFDGYETSSILISFVLYKLAEFPEMQTKLREEITNSIQDLENVNFDTLNNLPYLEAFINETLRLYPPGTVLTRLCTKDITLHCEGMDYPVKKGQTVLLPIFSIQRNPQYFHDPEKFDPERFMGESSNMEGFMPFGLGPRQCLGSRFALLQTKMAIVALVKNFEITLRDPPKEFEFDETVFILLIVKGGLWIKFKSLKK